MTDKIVLTSGTVFDSASIISSTYTESVNSETDICPGAVCSAELEIELRANYGAITQGTTFTHYIVADDGTQTQMGVFTAEKPERISSVSYRVLAYDNVSKLYSDASAWLHDNQGQFPMSLFEIAQTACQQCGLTLSNSTIQNGSFQVQAFYADGLTWADIISWVAQASCTFVRATPDGDLEFAWYVEKTAVGVNTGDSEGQWTALDLAGELLSTVNDEIWTFGQQQIGYKINTLAFEDYSTAILDKVQIRQSDEDIGTIYPAYEQGTNTYVVQGNMLLAPLDADTLVPIAKTIYESLSKIQYTPGSVEILPTLSFRAGDVVSVYPENGSSKVFYITTMKLSGSGVALECTGNASRDSSAAVNSAKYTNLSGKMLEISASVEGLKVTASNLQGGMTQLELTVDGLTTQVSGKLDEEEAETMIQQSLESITLSASTDGDTSKLTLSAGGIELSSTDITFKGMVTFAALSGSGTSVINGDNITTGTIGNQAGNTVYDLDAGTIRTGRSNSNRVNINDRGINWYVEQGGTSYLTGVLYSIYGSTYIGCNSRYSYFGWFSGAAPTFGWSSGGKTGSFCGIAIDQVDGLIHCNAAKFEIPGRIECSSLAVNGREI